MARKDVPNALAVITVADTDMGALETEMAPVVETRAI